MGLPTTPRLLRALADARPERVRQTLLGWWLESPDMAHQASAILLVDEDKAVSVHDSDEESKNGDAKDQSADSKARVPEPRSAAVDNQANVQALLHGIKRLQPRYAVCTNCKEEFDVTGSRNGDRVWHNGNAQCTNYR